MSYTFQSKADTGRVITGHNDVDDHNNPAGGYANDGFFDYKDETMPFFSVTWQDGPVDRAANQRPNGAFVEDLLEVCRRRLGFYESSLFACEENADAIQKIEGALEALAARRTRRVSEGLQTPAS